MITEAAYRFARHEPWVDVVLIGTGDPDHLRTNIASHLKLALPDTVRRQLSALFGHLTGIGLDLPPHKVARKIEPIIPRIK
jgi:L-galactose dehydrogenase